MVVRQALNLLSLSEGNVLLRVLRLQLAEPVFYPLHLLICLAQLLHSLGGNVVIILKNPLVFPVDIALEGPLHGLADRKQLPVQRKLCQELITVRKQVCKQRTVILIEIEENPVLQETHWNRKRKYPLIVQSHGNLLQSLPAFLIFRILAHHNVVKQSVCIGGPKRRLLFSKRLLKGLFLLFKGRNLRLLSGRRLSEHLQKLRRHVEFRHILQTAGNSRVKGLFYRLLHTLPPVFLRFSGCRGNRLPQTLGQRVPCQKGEPGRTPGLDLRL